MKYFLLTTAPLFMFPAGLFAGDPGVKISGITSDDSDLSFIVDYLEESCILFLLGAVVLFALIWMGYIFSAVSQPQKRRHPANKGLFSMILLMTAMVFFNSSCSVEQRTRAVEIRAALAAEEGPCGARHRHLNQGYDAPQGRGSVGTFYGLDRYCICKFCGQRIYCHH